MSGYIILFLLISTPPISQRSKGENNGSSGERFYDSNRQNG